MRRLRILSIILFIFAIGSYGIFSLREVQVNDKNGPVITMDDDSITVSANADEEDLLEGVEAEDEKDGDVTDSLLIESMSNFIEKGRRKITIAAFDSDGNVSKTTREISYKNYESPQFSCDKPFRYAVGTESIIEDLTAEDMLDGDVTSQIKVSSEELTSTYQAGTYEVVFSVTNSAGDVSKLTVDVDIYDPDEESSSVGVELTKYVVYTEKGKELDPTDYLEDGYSSYNVSISDKVDYDKEGTYKITYKTSSTSGSNSVDLYVVVI